MHLMTTKSIGSTYLHISFLFNHFHNKSKSKTLFSFDCHLFKVLKNE